MTGGQSKSYNQDTGPQSPHESLEEVCPGSTCALEASVKLVNTGGSMRTARSLHVRKGAEAKEQAAGTACVALTTMLCLGTGHLAVISSLVASFASRFS